LGYLNKKWEPNEWQESLKNIADGAMAFLKAEYRVLAIFVVAVAIFLGFSGNT
jgi:Na+/H+-translocating membrane pyrophosphatase